MSDRGVFDSGISTATRSRQPNAQVTISAATQGFIEAAGFQQTIQSHDQIACLDTRIAHDEWFGRQLGWRNDQPHWILIHDPLKGRCDHLSATLKRRYRLLQVVWLPRVIIINNGDMDGRRVRKLPGDMVNACIPGASGSPSTAIAEQIDRYGLLMDKCLHLPRLIGIV